MVGASWRLAWTMLCEVGAKMGPRSEKNVSDGDLGAVLAPSWVQYFFSKSRPEAPGPERITANGVGRRRRRGPGEGKGGENPHPD